MTPPADRPPGIARHDDWTAAGLVAAKEALAGTRVSLVIPARDEEATVGGIVAGLRAALMLEVPLVDEIVVIDSDSTDATAAKAASAGARVHAARDIRPDLPPATGKGEALWKSQFVTAGDILVFVDSDLLDWGPHFVVGLLGPLLTRPEVNLVKAVYDRPMLDPDGHVAEQGGRVTELVARPLLALHFPELAGVIQPLAGEWAVRRTAFESYAVPVGYGVEIAALVDTAQQFGAGSIAQVDLGRRTHRHHRHDTLGPMAVQVLAAVEARLGARRSGSPGGPGGPEERVELRQFDAGPHGFTARSQSVDVAERPPARGLCAAPGVAEEAS